MPKFKTKPVVKEAIQYFGVTSFELMLKEWGEVFEDAATNYPVLDIMEIATLEGTMRAEFGDWIIKGIQGEFYPCKAEVFAKTYEEVNE